jgi:GT2 family glycosyltransferase
MSSRSQLQIFDVVTVTYKCYDELEKCVESIRQTNNIQLVDSFVVVDNSPSDEYWDQNIAKLGPITLIQNRKNKGFGKAANQGIRKGCAPYVALINPDCVVNEKAFKEALTYLELNPDVAILGPKILEEDGSLQGSARAFPSVSNFLFGRSSVLSRLFPNSKWVKRSMPCFALNPEGTEGIPVDWVSGAAMFIRREALRQVGLFDERFFMYWEDVGLCQRLRCSGWQVIYYPIPTVTHLIGRSSMHHPWKRELYFYKSAFLLANKQDNHLVPWRSLLVVYGLTLHMIFRFLNNLRRYF